LFGKLVPERQTILDFTDNGGGGAGNWNFKTVRNRVHPAPIIVITTSSFVSDWTPFLPPNQPEASTPYKRWSKCTMEKVGGSVFAET